MSLLDHCLPPLTARGGKRDGQASVALARSPNKCATASAALTLLARQLGAVKNLPLQVGTGT
jgi:hypothetical protein